MNKIEHLLVCLSEECAEVQHAVSKALRFGLNDLYSTKETTNAQDITRELIDLMAVVEMLEEAGAIKISADADAVEALERKRTKVKCFMHYAESVGTLTK